MFNIWKLIEGILVLSVLVSSYFEARLGPLSNGISNLFFAIILSYFLLNDTYYSILNDKNCDNYIIYCWNWYWWDTVIVILAVGYHLHGSRFTIWIKRLLR